MRWLAIMMPVVFPTLAFADIPAGSLPSLLDFAVYATGNTCAAINMSGGAYTDSFDSSQGSYLQTKQAAKGNVGVSANITLSGSALINGSIFALNITVGQCHSGSPG